MYKAIEIKSLLNINSLGEAILLQTLSNAYYLITKSPVIRYTEHKREAEQDLQFVKEKSGIYQIINIFSLSMDADKLQNLFFYYVKVA